MIDIFGNPAKSIYSTLQELWHGSNKVHVDEAVVLTITPAARAIYIVKDIIATMPMGLHRRTDDGDIDKLDAHPLSRLLRSPNPLMTWYDFMSAMIVNAMLSGNGIAEIKRDARGVAKALWPIPYSDLEDIIMSEPEGLVYYLLKNGKRIEGSNVLHFKMMSYNGLAGLNTTQLHKNTLATEIALRDYVRQFLEQGAHIKGFISVPGVLSKDAKASIAEQWTKKYSGPLNSGSTPILEGGSDFKKIQATIVEAGYEQVKSGSIADISRIYGVPEYMIDSKNKPTYASIEHIALDFKRYTMDGWFTQIEQQMTMKLVSADQAGVMFFAFDRSGMINGDMKAMGEYFTKMFNIGVMNRNEIRGKMNMNKVEDGDRYFVQGNNMIPVDVIDDFLEAKKGGGVDVKGVTEGGDGQSDEGNSGDDEGDDNEENEGNESED